MQAVGWSSAAKGNAPCSREETWRGRDARDRVNEARAGRLRAPRPQPCRILETAELRTQKNGQRLQECGDE